MASVLVACEYSGRVREAFRARGHDAWSCDLLPAEDESAHHFCGDVREVVGLKPWALIVAHPPCTYLTNAGARWWAQRQEEQAQALEFVRWLMGLPVERIAIENPPGRIGTAIRKADQYVHPWQFGHPETKTTGLWLKNLPPLRSTQDVRAEMESLPESVRHRVHWMPPSADRWKERSRTYPGIAAAMADQWGPLIESQARTVPSPEEFELEMQ